MTAPEPTVHRVCDFCRNPVAGPFVFVNEDRTCAVCESCVSVMVARLKYINVLESIEFTGRPN